MHVRLRWLHSRPGTPGSCTARVLSGGHSPPVAPRGRGRGRLVAMGQGIGSARSTVGVASPGGLPAGADDGSGGAAGPGRPPVWAFVGSLVAGAVGSLLVAVVWTWLVAPMVAPTRVSPPRGVPSPVQTCYQDAVDPGRFDCVIRWTA